MGTNDVYLDGDRNLYNNNHKEAYSCLFQEKLEGSKSPHYITRPYSSFVSWTPLCSCGENTGINPMCVGNIGLSSKLSFRYCSDIP